MYEQKGTFLFVLKTVKPHNKKSRKSGIFNFEKMQKMGGHKCTFLFTMFS